MTDDSDLASVLQRCDNRGRWATPRRGTLNLADGGAFARAISSISHGRVVELGRVIVPSDRPGAEANLIAWRHQNAIVDRLDVEIHGFAVTHIDAVGHNELFGELFTGALADEAYRPSGSTSGDAEGLGSVLTRGVLLDVAASRGRDALPEATRIGARDLDEAAQHAGVAILPGDAVFVRSGAGADDPATGLDLSAVEWLFDHDVSLYSGDCIEALPSGLSEVAMPLHQIGQARMGLVILDNPDVELLTATCAELDSSAFALVVCPLRVRGGTGSAVNPVAIF